MGLYLQKPSRSSRRMSGILFRLRAPFLERDFFVENLLVRIHFQVALFQQVMSLQSCTDLKVDVVNFRGSGALIPHNVFLTSFCIRQLPQKSVNLTFAITDMENYLTDFLLELTLQDDFEKNV